MQLLGLLPGWDDATLPPVTDEEAPILEGRYGALVLQGQQHEKQRGEQVTALVGRQLLTQPSAVVELKELFP